MGDDDRRDAVHLLVHDHTIAVDVNEEMRLARVRDVEQGTGFHMVPGPTKRANRTQPHGYEVFALVATTNDFG